MTLIIACAAALPGVALAAGATPGRASLCATQEKVVFSCMAGRKIVSICASTSFPAAGSTLQYRFGSKAAPELALPQDGASRQGVTTGGISYSRGGGAYLAFVRGPFRYVVYSEIMNSGADEKQGLVVTKGSELVSEQTCRRGGLIDNLQPDMPGVPADAAGFDAP